MPSYSKALQKSGGKLLPFGWWHFYRQERKNDRANFYLIGIHPDYQRRGVTSIIFKEIWDIFRKKELNIWKPTGTGRKQKHSAFMAGLQSL
jgi:GNAT superfamily N-acetyltransferase